MYFRQQAKYVQFLLFADCGNCLIRVDMCFIFPIKQNEWCMHMNFVRGHHFHFQKEVDLEVCSCDLEANLGLHKKKWNIKFSI